MPEKYLGINKKGKLTRQSPTFTGLPHKGKFLIDALWLRT